MLDKVLYKYAKHGVVSFTQRGRIWELFREGMGVTKLRNLVRSEGFKLSNQTISNVIKEERQVQRFATAVNRTKSNRTVAKHLIVKTPQRFGTKYMYRARAIIKSDSGITEVELGFGDDRLLRSSMVREKFKDIGQRIAAKGGPDSDLVHARLVRIELDSVIEGAQNVA